MITCTCEKLHSVSLSSNLSISRRSSPWQQPMSGSIPNINKCCSLNVQLHAAKTQKRGSAAAAEDLLHRLRLFCSLVCSLQSYFVRRMIKWTCQWTFTSFHYWAERNNIFKTHLLLNDSYFYKRKICKMRPADDQESTGQPARSVLDINQSKWC